MKKFILIICLVFSLFIMCSCASDAPTVTPDDVSDPLSATVAETPAEPTSAQESAVEQSHEFAELGFGLEFPAIWHGRYEIMQEGDVVSVQVDGELFSSYTAVENTTGAWQAEAPLLADGYQYLCQTENRIYYYKVFRPTPSDLSAHFTGHGGGGYISEEAYDARSLFFIQTELCSFNGGSLTDITFTLSDLQYTDYRLGLSLSLPEAWSEQYVLTCNDHCLSISTCQGASPILSFHVPNAHSTACSGTTEYTYLGTGEDREYYACIHEYDGVSEPDAETIRNLLPELYTILEPVKTSAESDEIGLVRSAAQSFLEDLHRVTYLYEELDLAAHTTASAAEADRAAICLPTALFPYHLLPTKQFASAHSDFTDQSRYILQTAQSLRSTRLSGEIVREEFRAEYRVHCVHVSDNFAQVWISDSKSFFYEGSSEESYLSDSYELYLVKCNGSWLVFDMFGTDGFDSITK